MNPRDNNGSDPPDEKAPAPDVGSEGKRQSEVTEQRGDSRSDRDGRKGVTDLTDIPAVREYLNRIGARPRSLRRAAVSKFDGQYWTDLATIRFADDGTVAVKDPTNRPTEDEQSRIIAAWASVNWPQYTSALSLTVNPPKAWQGQDENLFILRARTRLPGQDKRDRPPILMVHQRVSTDDGKNYWCWTFYDDDQWRLAEPPDGLPLYGLENLNGKTLVYLHEGAKAASECARLVAKGEHPWPELALEDTAHMGWVGGANAVGKTDWSQLAEAGIRRVIVVADNDDAGKEAITDISKALSRWDIAVSAIQFTDDFPNGWDMGDRLKPEAAPDLFAQDLEGRPIYVGPALHELERPATWATAAIPMPPKTGAGRPPKQSYYLRSAFMREWSMAKTVKGPIFVNRQDRSRLLTEQSFSAETRGRADCPILDMFKAEAFARTVDGIAYEPGRPVEITVDGRRQINTWVPSRIRPARNAHPDSWSFWVDFLTRLFPVEDERLEVIRWIGTLIARPKVRMLYALLLYSHMQGVGKTTLCAIIRVLVGEHNSGCPSASDIVNSAFNGWLVRRRFIFVNEIYESGNLKAYDLLKTYITDGIIEANEKMIPQYPVANQTHYIFCSNSEAPLSVDAKDRRIFVPKVAEEKPDVEWWRAFYSRLNPQGYAAIAAWAEFFVREHGAVQPGAVAPMTGRKQLLIEDSQSRMELLVKDCAELAKNYEHNGLIGAVIVVSDLEEWLTGQFTKSKLPPANVLRRWLTDAGMIQSSKRLKVDGRRQLVFLPRAMNGDGWPSLRAYRASPAEMFGNAKEM